MPKSFHFVGVANASILFIHQLCIGSAKDFLPAQTIRGDQDDMFGLGAFGGKPGLGSSEEPGQNGQRQNQEVTTMRMGLRFL